LRDARRHDYTPNVQKEALVAVLSSETFATLSFPVAISSFYSEFPQPKQNGPAGDLSGLLLKDNIYFKPSCSIEQTWGKAF